MEPTLWCELCQSKPATGSLYGYFASLEEEPLTMLTCEGCAQEALALK